MSSTTSEGLTSLSYEKQYYQEHVRAGLDYLGHGFGQKSYAAMVTEATFQASYPDPFILDAGCACGSTLKGFKDIQVYKRVTGVDLSEYMVLLGRKHFCYTDKELVVGSIADLPVESESVTLLHSNQVLEHVPDELIDRVAKEFVRVLRPGGRTFLCCPALRVGEQKEMYMGDPTHVNIQPVLYWTRKFHNVGLVFDLEAYNRYVRSPLGPKPKDKDARSFFHFRNSWNVWTLIRA